MGDLKRILRNSGPSMKVPPKRKGNIAHRTPRGCYEPSMKVPPKRKGNLGITFSGH